MAAPLSQGNASANDAFPSFLESDPFPSINHGGRRDSNESGTTDAMSANGTITGASVPSITGPVGEPGLPPARYASANASSTTSARSRSVQNPSAARRNLNALSAKLGKDSGKSTEPAVLSTTHVPSLNAQGFARPMSSQKLQSQRAAMTTSVTQGGLGGVDEDDEDNGGPRRRYSNASINTLRERMPPTRDGAAPPLPSSRGTDSNQAHEMTVGSVGSDHSAAPLQAAQHRGVLHLDVVHPRAPTAQSGTRSPQSFRASWTMGSKRTSRQDQAPQPAAGTHERLHSTPTSLDNEKRLTAALPQSSDHKNAKNYEFFAGNLIFFFKGRCLNARAGPLNAATFVVITLGTALFLVFSAPWLWHNISPALPIVFGYVYFLTISSFAHAALSDPGILPRNIHPHPPNPAEEDPWTLGPPTTDWVMVRAFTSKKAKKRELQDPEGHLGPTTLMEIPTKYCKSCNIWRPPRAHHCRVCDACIETQDHHCMWLNNCVGRRNYRYFFSFVGFGSLLALMLVGFSLTHVILYGIRNDIGFGDALSGRLQERMAFAMVFYGAVALLYPLSLSAYHLFLMSRGDTTREFLVLKDLPEKDKHHPFSQQSMLRTLLAVLMRPRPPSYMSFKSRYEPGDLRFGHIKSKKDRRRDLKHRFSASRNDTEKHELSPIQPGSSSAKHQASPVESGHRLNRPINNTPR